MKSPIPHVEHLDLEDDLSATTPLSRQTSSVYYEAHFDESVSVISPGPEVARGADGVVCTGQLLSRPSIAGTSGVESRVAIKLPYEKTAQSNTLREIHEMLDALGYPKGSAVRGLITLIGTPLQSSLFGQRRQIHAAADATAVCAVYPYCDFILSHTIPILIQLKSAEPEVFQYLQLNLFSDLLNALEHLQAAGFIHGDFNPDNVAVRHQHFIAIDFDRAKKVTDLVRDPLSKQVGKKGYIAPEFFITHLAHAMGCTQFNPYTINAYASDVFSVGQILRQVARGATQSLETQEGTNFAESLCDTYELDDALISHDPETLKTKQTKIRADSESRADFTRKMDFFIERMCEVHPLYRPTLDTLKYARLSLVEALPVLTPRQKSLVDGYYQQTVTECSLRVDQRPKPLTIDL